ncbi:MAG TPA: GIY-YIG nuclease family protein [Ignavibacteria bacterium]|jgi:putative endonuclease
MNKWYVYILQSKKDKSFYIGCTENLELRIKEHNSGLSKYTSKKIPWALKYFEELKDMKSARSREAFLKRQRNRKFYERLIKTQLVTPEHSG